MSASTGEDVSKNFVNVFELCQKVRTPSVLAIVGKTLTTQLDLYHQQLTTIASFAPKYDSKLGVKANGFRSFIKVRKTPV